MRGRKLLMLKNLMITLSRWITGFVFIFSGFVKGVDPMGSAIKFTDYFTAFRLDFMIPLAEELALLLILAEYMVGAALLLGFRIREASWGALIFMIFFLPLTLYLAIFNPVSDCGCFGDALVLTNWETFYKNCIISIPVVMAFLTRKEKPLSIPLWKEALLLAASLALILYVSLYGLTHMPLIDFRPYHIGSNIPEKMKIPEGAPTDEYETILVYEKDGKQQEFTLDNYPWQDTTWTWVETRSVLVSEGYKPPIDDFMVTDRNGNDVTRDILSDPGFVFLLISYDLEKARESSLIRADSLSWHASAGGMRFYGLTASPEMVIESKQEKLGLSYPFLLADETLLKTIVRSNPCLILLKEGTVVNKWSARDVPSRAPGSVLLLAESLNTLRKSGDRWWAFSVFAGLLLFSIFIKILPDKMTGS
ncbi:MAG TPA: DoxX family membrane protein [Bacteroidetes bacterium]|nr:DoxX family membrane protein [Bacteroidota bacterium]